MSKKKPIVDKGVILYYDYDFIFNFLTDDELGKVTRLLIQKKDNPTLNPTENANVNNAYNYIATRIIDYKNERGIAQEFGRKGGNPTLTLKGTDKTGDKLKDNTIQYNTIQNNTKPDKIKKVYVAPEEATGSANFLKEIIQSKSNIKIHSITAWAKDIDKLNRLDGVEWDRIISALQWYQDHYGGEYVPVIESGVSLRSKFGKLESAIKRDPRQKQINENQAILDMEFDDE